MKQTLWKTLGAPKFVSAPMVDQSELAFRLLVRQNGADLAFSQMMHGRNFVIDCNYRRECIDWNDYSTKNNSMAHQQWATKLDRPLIAQLASDDPNILVKAGKFIDQDVTAIDLNLGCPQKIAKRGHYGAYLLPEKDLIVQLLTVMVTNLACPITAKIRRLASDEETIALAQAIEGCGVQMLTVHGRTVASSKLFTGPADWDIIRKIRQSVSIPVVANGGVACYNDALRCLEYTGADAVMSSEGLLENPKLFSYQGDKDYHDNYIAAQMRTTREYLDLIHLFPLPLPTNAVVRGHLFRMLFRLWNAPQHFDLRDRLSAANNLQEMVAIFEELDHRMTRVSYDMDYATKNNLLSSTSWYMRHRDKKALLRSIATPKMDYSGIPMLDREVAERKRGKTAEEMQQLKLRLQEKYAHKKMTTTNVTA